MEEQSDWISGMVATEKKSSGALRIDPRPLNRALKCAHYPLPTVEDVLLQLQDAKVFSVCDLQNGYLHVKLDHKSSKLTTFATPIGRY